MLYQQLHWTWEACSYIFVAITIWEILANQCEALYVNIVNNTLQSIKRLYNLSPSLEAEMAKLEGQEPVFSGFIYPVPDNQDLLYPIFHHARVHGFQPFYPMIPPLVSDNTPFILCNICGWHIACPTRDSIVMLQEHLTNYPSDTIWRKNAVKM